MAPQHPRAHDMWPQCDRPPDEILAAQLCEAQGANMAIYSGFIVDLPIENDDFMDL